MKIFKMILGWLCAGFGVMILYSVDWRILVALILIAAGFVIRGKADDDPR